MIQTVNIASKPPSRQAATICPHMLVPHIRQQTMKEGSQLDHYNTNFHPSIKVWKVASSLRKLLRTCPAIPPAVAYRLFELPQVLLQLPKLLGQLLLYMLL